MLLIATSQGISSFRPDEKSGLHCEMTGAVVLFRLLFRLAACRDVDCCRNWGGSSSISHIATSRGPSTGLRVTADGASPR